MTKKRPSKVSSWAPALVLVGAPLIFIGVANCKGGGAASGDSQPNAGDDGGDGADALADGSQGTGPFAATVVAAGMCTGIDTDGRIVGLDPPTSVPAAMPRAVSDEFGGIDETSLPNIFRIGTDGKKTALSLPKAAGLPVLPIGEWRLPSPRLRGGKLLGLGQAMYADLSRGCSPGPGCGGAPRGNAAPLLTHDTWSSIPIAGDVILAYVAGASSTGAMVGAYRVDNPPDDGGTPESTASEGGAHDVPFLVVDGKITVLEGGDAVALDINTNGDIVGKSAFDDFSRAVQWKGTKATKLDAEARNSVALAINDKGQAVGAVQGSDQEPRAALFAGGSVTLIRPLGDERSVAHAITAAGTVVGQAAVKGTAHAFVWENGVTTDLNPKDANGDAFATSTVTDVTADGRMAVGNGVTAQGAVVCVKWVRK